MLAKRDNVILFDWFSVTSKIDDVSTILDLLQLYDLPFEDCKGFHGFRYRKYFSGISIHYDRDDGLVWLEMSGKGCRAYETYSKNPDWNKLFEHFLSDFESYHITRLDVAYDDFNKILRQDKMFKAMQKQNLVTSFRDYGVEHMSITKSDFTLYFGSRSSDCYFRVYNKAAEQDKEEEISHWVRFEIQLRNDRATQFLLSYMMSDYNLGETFSGVVSNYVRFVDSSSDSNKSRWKTSKWWSKFIGDAERISIYSKKLEEYTEAKLQDYVFGQAGQAINCAIDIYGTEGFLQYLDNYLKNKAQTANPKYQELVERITGGVRF